MTMLDYTMYAVAMREWMTSYEGEVARVLAHRVETGDAKAGDELRVFVGEVIGRAREAAAIQAELERIQAAERDTRPPSKSHPAGSPSAKFRHVVRSAPNGRTADRPPTGSQNRAPARR